MNVVISIKRSSFKDTDSAVALQTALSTGSGTTTKVFLPGQEEAMDRHIAHMARNGYLVRTAEVTGEYKTETSIIATKVG